MSEYAPPLNIPVPTDLALDVLTTGMDYAARAYWAQIETYQWYWWYVPDAKGEPTDVVSPTLMDASVLISMRDDEDGMAEAEERPFVGITLYDLKAAIQWAITNYNHLFSFTVSKGVITEMDYDSTGADVVVQKAVLDEVIYG
jgi:hypothetical protein